MPALETLAVIAYKQPVTIPEIQEIRGVSASGVIKTLLERELITTAGRKAVIGRPILYRTSKEFMMRFGLSDLDELPSLKEFEQLAQAALGSDSGIAPIEPELTGEAGETVEVADAGQTAQPAEASVNAEALAKSENEAGAAPSVGEVEVSQPDSEEFTAEAQRAAENTKAAAAGAGAGHEASSVTKRGEDSEEFAEKGTQSEEDLPSNLSS